MTVESIGFGQFVRVREIRVALPMSEGFAPEAYRLSPGSDADQGYIKSGGEHTAHRRSRKR